MQIGIDKKVISCQDEWLNSNLSELKTVMDHKGKQSEEGKPVQFLDDSGQSIQFVPGQIWMHALDKGHSVNYYEKPKNK